MNITQNDIVTTMYLFLIVGGIITLFGGLTVYFNRRVHRRK